ncbi:MAG: M6 family metalloprotease domain-containing protein [Candidatus Hydrogenedentales bacterium]|jgi:M6 family metalloprotease-like protein
MCKLASCNTPYARVPGRSLAAWLLAVFLMITAPEALAVPYFGDEVFTYRQPDGSTFGVRLYGDEFFAYQRTADEGREVVFDDATGFWCYAKLSADGRSFVSTGIPVTTLQKSSPETNKALAIAAGAVQPNATLPFDAMMSRVHAEREALTNVVQDYLAGTGIPHEVQPKAAEGTIVGLCILVDFSDDEATISQAEVGRFLNQTSDYTEFGNACSVNEYFHIQSNGLLNYVNVVTPWVRMPYPKVYYDDNSVSSSKPGELLSTARAILTQQGYDFGAYSALNVFYAGDCWSGWRRGLWPHAGGGYQMTAMGSSLALGTFCHENGHMICGFPDLYSYTSAYMGVSAALVGEYCLMCAGGGTHPPNFSPILKANAGWAEIVQLPYDGRAQYGLLQADRNRFYAYTNPERPNEFFLLENRNDTGYEGPYGGGSACAPGRGLVVWHIDRNGSNMYSSIQDPMVDEEDLFERPYYAFVVEAEPSSTDPWYADPNPVPDEHDTFYAGHGANPLYSYRPLQNSHIFGEADPDDPDKVELSHPDLCFWNREDFAEGRTVISNMVLSTFGEQDHFMPFVAGVNPTQSVDWLIFGVSSAPRIETTCSTIRARCNWGQNPPNQHFRVFNSGKGTLYFTLESDQPWLLVSPGFGFAQPTLGGEDFEVFFDATNLPTGQHLGTITVFAPDQVPANPLYIGVTLDVEERPELLVTPETISLSLKPNEVSTDRLVKVANVGGSTMKYTVTSSCPDSPWDWLTPYVDSGLCVGDVEDSFILTIAPSDAGQKPPVLPAGIHTGIVTVASSGALNSPQNTIVTLNVDGYMEVVSPNGGEVWQPNLDLTVPIVWATNSAEPVGIELVRWDPGLSDYVFVQTIASDIPYDGDPDADGQSTYNWSLPIDFTPGADYRVRVFSGGSSWNTAVHRDDSDADFRILRVAYNTPMDSDPDWTLEGEWAWGAPTGAGGGEGGSGNVSNPDPTSGYSGDFVVGYNLSGNYANGMTTTEYATLGPINCEDFVDLNLTFRRWLGVERTDNAVIEISNDNTAWHQVWQNPPDMDITDGGAGAWALVSYDISEYADSKPTVWIRWGLGPTDATDRFCGWNLDDVAVHGRYLRVGAITVMITPPGAASAGAQWRRLGTTTWFDSDDTETGVPVGTYSIEFKDVPEWLTPGHEIVEVLKSKTTLANGTYRQVGSLQVNIAPAGAASAGAQWRRVGQSIWRDSGFIESGVFTGAYTVEFKPIHRWHAPASQPVTIASEQTTLLTGTYEEIKYGSLQVLISPAEALSAGAKWRRVGTGAWLNSGATENDLPVGPYTIEFNALEDWQSPAAQNVAVTENKLSVATAAYTKIIKQGSLQVTIQPVAARMAGAQWRRVGTLAWHNSGMVEASVDEGEHLVEFKPVTGWVEPADVLVTVAPEETAQAAGSYTMTTGMLQVFIEPQDARDDGALWRRMDSVTPKEGSEAESGNVFHLGTPVLDGATLDVPLLLSRGDDVLSQDTFDANGLFAGGSAPAAFALDVVYDPALLSLPGEAEGENADAGSYPAVEVSEKLTAWYGHTVTVSEPLGPNTGRLRLIFADPVHGHPITTGDNVRPDGDPADSENPFQLATLRFDCNAAEDGSVHLLIQNLTVTDGEQMLEHAQALPVSFKMSKGSDWLPSGATETGITPGSYVVEFSDVAGWTTPDEQSVTIAGNETAFATGTYVALPTEGSLTVTLAPADAVAAGAQWRRQGTLTWFDSGSTETGILEGTYTVEFKTVAGWTAPAAQTVTITADETTAAAAAYVEKVVTGSLRVTLAPQAAVNAGAQWRRAGTAAWKNSGVTEDGLPVGAYTVEFKEVSNWQAPASANVSVEANQTAQLSGTYTAKGGGTIPGGCPLLTKALQPFVDLQVYEPVLPSAVDDAGLRETGPLTPLAIRLRANEAIDEASVWGTVYWGDAMSDEVTWLALDAAGTDGWVLFQPESSWPDGEVVVFTAGAVTVSGDVVGPFMYEFSVKEDVYDGEAVVAEAGEAAARHAEFVGTAYEIAPDRVYLEPVVVQLPVPAGVDPSGLEPSYLFVDDGRAEWVTGNSVAGWLEPGSVRVVDADGLYIEFAVLHGGVVQLRKRSADVSPAQMPSGGISGDLLAVLGVGGFLLLRKRMSRRAGAR